MEQLTYCRSCMQFVSKFRVSKVTLLLQFAALVAVKLCYRGGQSHHCAYGAETGNLTRAHKLTPWLICYIQLLNASGPAAEEYTANAPAELDPGRGALATASWVARNVPGTPSRGQNAAHAADCLPDSAEQAPHEPAGASPAQHPDSGAAHRLGPALDAAAAPSSAAAGHGNSNPNPEPDEQLLCGRVAARVEAARGSAGAAGCASAKATVGPPSSAAGKENLGPGEPGAVGGPDAQEDSDVTDAGGSGAGHDEVVGASGGAGDADSGELGGHSGEASLRAAAEGAQAVPANAAAPAAMPATLGFAYSEACPLDGSQGRLAGQVTITFDARGVVSNRLECKTQYILYGSQLPGKMTRSFLSQL